MNNNNEDVQLEIEETVSIQAGETGSTSRKKICSYFRRIFTLDDDQQNEKHHRPIFIIFMSILHIIIYQLIDMNIRWKDQDLVSPISHLFRFFLPCMRPAPAYIRTTIVTCEQFIQNRTCYYDDRLKNICYSFMYPHQIWRMLTVNFLHMDKLHLIANISAQLLYGIPLERKYGSGCIALIYWLANVGAALCFMLINREKVGVGASGAIYGLLLLVIVDRFVALRTEIDHRCSILIQLAVLVVLPRIILIPLRITYKRETAHSAHFGGALVGFLSGIYMAGCPCPWNSDYCISRIVARRIAFIFLLFYFIITFLIFFLIDAPEINWFWYD